MAEIVGKMQMVHVTLQDIWRSGVARLEAAGIEEAGPDAELLLLHVLGMSKAQLLRDWREPWPQSPALQSAWEAMLARRAAGEPVQYVIGEQSFYGRRFFVNPSVLIPRPETELLVETVLAEVDRIWSTGKKADNAHRTGGNNETSKLPGSSSYNDNCQPVPHVLDVGTGSGVLAVTIGLERPTWQVTASDLSANAIEVARQNAKMLGADGRIRFVQGNLLEPFLDESQRIAAQCHQRECAAHHAKTDSIEFPLPTQSDFPWLIDVLVSNPPYIPTGDMTSLQREVRDFEPDLALDGGDDGLEAYRQMAMQLRALPAMPRIVAWEVGAGQAEDVANLLRVAADWSDIRFVLDYTGIRRHVFAVR